jgi:hypothetical protein
MNVWMDGLSVLTNEWRLVTVILALVLSSLSLTNLLLRKVFGDRLSRAEYLALGLAGWTVPAFIISLIWYFTGFKWIIWILPAALIFVFLIRFESKPRPDSTLRSLFLLLFLSLAIVLRLAYISQATFPLYFDSAQHYSLTKIILARDGSHLLDILNASYYHTGFHFLTACLASVSGSEVTRVMLSLGQITLALIPFSAFFLVRHETNSDAAGWLALLLYAFGWYMPAHAVNWGKYPALMSLGLMPFVLCLAYLLYSNKDLSHGKRRLLVVLLFASILLSVLTHSRSLIVLAILLLAWIIVTWLEKRSQRWMLIAFIPAVIVMIVLAAFILGQNILALLFDPYLFKGIPITALVLLLSIFAWMVYPRLTFVCVLAMTLLLASLFIPVTWMPGSRDLTLLDRPFVEMILFLPLSLLGGLGLAGLTRKLQGRYMWGSYIGLLAGGIVIINAFLIYNPYPSDCCVIVGNDDVVAMDWVANWLPVDARIGIASAELKVLQSESSEGNVGADAGIWITPLTGRVTIPLAYDTDFSRQATLERLCELEIKYLFVGETGQPFDVDRIKTHPEWYRPLLSMPKTGVYEVTGCE